MIDQWYTEERTGKEDFEELSYLRNSEDEKSIKGEEEDL